MQRFFFQYIAEANARKVQCHQYAIVAINYINLNLSVSLIDLAAVHHSTYRSSCRENDHVNKDLGSF